MATDEALRSFNIPLTGRLITADDPITIGKNFQTLKNLRYSAKTPRGVGGMTKINTNPLIIDADGAPTNYFHIQNGFHFKKAQPAESHVLVQATKTDDSAPRIIENTTAIPNTGDFPSTHIYTEDTAAGMARFSDAPDGHVAMCDSKESCIWGGNESRIAAFLTSTATIDTSLTNPQDFTENLQNTLTDKVAPIGSGIDSDTVLMLHCDGAEDSTTFTDSSASPHTITVQGTAHITQTKKKFGTASGQFDGNSDYLQIDDHADFDFSGGIWTVDFWVRVFNYSGELRTLYYQRTDANNYMRIYADTGHFHLRVVSGGSTVVSLSTTGTAFLLNKWYHIAVVENGDEYYIFVDAVQEANVTDTSRPANYTDKVYIGAEPTPSYFHGWLDEIRVSKGVARWTSDFNLPTKVYQTANLDFVIGSTRPLKGVKFYIPAGSGNDDASATLSMKEWNGSDWDSRNITDLTSGLEQTGRVTWAATNEAAIRFVEGRVLYWYNFTLSGGNCETYYITLEAPFQPINDIWDGALRPILSYKVFADSKFQDYTVNVIQNSYDSGNTGTYATLNSGGLTSSEYQLIGFLERQTAININLFEDDVNAVTSTLTVSYWDGTNWVSAGNIVDGTLEGSASFAKSGIISWQSPASAEEFKKSITGEFPLYYYKLQQSATMTASVKLYYIAGIPAQKEISGYKFPFHADNSLFLCSDQSGKKNSVIRSKPNASDVYNGAGSIELFFGDEKELTTATALYTRIEENVYDIKLFFKANAMFGLTGKTIEDYKIINISESIGCVAPLTLATAVITTEKGTFPIAIWQGANGIYMYNNIAPLPVHEDLRNFFDENETNANKIHASYIADSVGFIDEEKMEYVWLFADGSSSGTLNREFVLDLKKFYWFERPRGSGKELQCGFKVIDTNGYNYNYGCIDTGYMERLENGTDFDGTAIAQEFQIGDVVLAPENNAMYETIIRYLGFTMEAKTTTTNKVAITHYGDGNNTGTVIDSANGFDPTKSGYRIVNIVKSVGGLNSHVYHSFKATMSTDDETVGLSPISIGGFYKLVREKIK